MKAKGFALLSALVPATAALGAGMLLAVATGTAPAQAAAFSPAIGAAVPQPAVVEDVRWFCNRSRCVWRPTYRGVVPSYARRWGPPRRASCVWTRTRSGRWVQIC